ncbi:UNVERIFIED_CONTAM: hypothetical protein GTU68_045690 [Idotea baltica]|nr:hypothetical protein [Idotea baltica]
MTLATRRPGMATTRKGPTMWPCPTEGCRRSSTMWMGTRAMWRMSLTMESRTMVGITRELDIMELSIMVPVIMELHIMDPVTMELDIMATMLPVTMFPATMA